MDYVQCDSQINPLMTNASQKLVSLVLNSQKLEICKLQQQITFLMWGNFRFIIEAVLKNHSIKWNKYYSKKITDKIQESLTTSL